MRKHVFTTDTRPSPLTTTHWFSLRSFFFCMSKETSFTNLMSNFIGSALTYNFYFVNSWRLLYDSYFHHDTKHFLIKKFQTVKRILISWMIFFTTRIRLSHNDWTWSLYFDFIHISNQIFLRLFIFVSQIPSFEFSFKRRGSSAATTFLFFVFYCYSKFDLTLFNSNMSFLFRFPWYSYRETPERVSVQSSWSFLLKDRRLSALLDIL